MLEVDARDALRFDRSVSALKRQLISWAKSEDFEIKGRDIRRGEKLFCSQSWEERLQSMRSIAGVLADQPVQAFVVLVDKRDLPDSIGSDDDLYRIAFWRLLDEVSSELSRGDDYGMLMADSRSNLHHSVQDRRLVDAYRDWVASRPGESRLVELPWFGFSAFYAGLQLADFVAYMTDFVSHEEERGPGRSELYDVFSVLRPKVNVMRIP